MDALKNIAKTISEYKAERLFKDQTIIKSYFMKERQYLSHLIGLFGPKNVLLPYLEEAIKTKTFQLSSPLIYNHPAEFLQKLEAVQQVLGEIIESEAHGWPNIKERGFANKRFAKLEDDLFSKFGGREQIQSALDNIKKSDMHKSFMKEMNDLGSERGILLQLVEPWGYFHQYKRIPFSSQEMLYHDFGVKNNDRFFKNLDQTVSSKALEIVQEKLKNAASVREAQQKIEGIFTSEGLQDFKNTLKENSLKEEERSASRTDIPQEKKEAEK
ncbi:hypothetical protein PCANC_26089 [Puccinia coronata f. sp. avenae]|uniref:Uncharacterized protein n=1 Tax=Puccinia coronata f. sp. avenae TaxID=200324 RepID=A0A2N5TJG8_9BASI|nr:hypothetical protein PCANC_26089 [Puccinia coronata f. sp. avenae]